MPKCHHTTRHIFALQVWLPSEFVSHDTVPSILTKPRSQSNPTLWHDHLLRQAHIRQHDHNAGHTNSINLSETVSEPAHSSPLVTSVDFEGGMNLTVQLTWLCCDPHAVANCQSYVAFFHLSAVLWNDPLFDLNLKRKICTSYRD